MGIVLGMLGAGLVSRIEPQIQAVLNPEFVLLATGFSAMEGLFGIYPAMRVASLHPIEAPRYE